MACTHDDRLPLDALPGEIHRGPDRRWYRLEWVALPGQEGIGPAPSIRRRLAGLSANER